MTPPYLTTTAVARHFRNQGRLVRPWQVRRLYEAGRLPEPAVRAGSYRLIAFTDLPAVEAALVACGYLAPAGQAVEAEGVAV